MIIKYFFSKWIIIKKVFGAVKWIDMNLTFVGYLVIFLYLVNHFFLCFFNVNHDPSRWIWLWHYHLCRVFRYLGAPKLIEFTHQGLRRLCNGFWSHYTYGPLFLLYLNAVIAFEVVCLAKNVAVVILQSWSNLYCVRLHAFNIHAL